MKNNNIETKILARKTNFDLHWDKNSSQKIPANKKKTAEGFLEPLIEQLISQHNYYVLDAGCGNGVHLEVLSKYKNTLLNNLFIGLDVSSTALKNIRLNNRLLVCGDMLNLPFSDNQFGAAISYGALGYTDKPFRSFTELCRVLKVGGLLGVWMYPRRKGLLWVTFILIRRICHFISPGLRRIIADCIVPFLSLLPTQSRVSLKNATWEQCREVVLINIEPNKLFFPTLGELENWFNVNKIKIIYNDLRSPITIWGIKQ